MICKIKPLFTLVVLLSLAACSDKDPLSANDTTVAGTPPENAAKLTVSDRATSGKFNRRRQTPRPLQADNLVAPITRHELPFGQTVTVDPLELTLLSVEDSRCPEGAVCVWEGEVSVEIGISEGGEQLAPITLRTGTREAALATVGTHTIALLNVNPHPEIEVPIDPNNYVASVSVGPALPAIPPKGSLTTSGDRVSGQEEKPPILIDPRPDPKPLDPDSPIVAALAENRAKWQELGSPDYTFNFQRVCFCLRDFTRQAVLTVEAGRITTAVFADTGEAVGELIDPTDAYYTIDQLFAQIDEATQQGAEIISVEYDEELGYPTDLFIDFSTGIADEEFTVTATNLQLVE